MRLLSEVYGNLINTGFALCIILLPYLFIDIFFAKKINSCKKKRRFRIRSFYVFSFVFICILARIWVEGFTHLLAVLGLVSAALVVSNKETIMNFVGCFIINWRGLFSEDDLIQVQQYKGYVRSFGLLYFSIQEVRGSSDESITGRVILIPNGLIISSPLINLSQTDHLLMQKLSIVISTKSNVPDSIYFLTKLIDDTLRTFNKGNKKVNADTPYKAHKPTELTTKVSVQLQQKDTKGVELTAYYYCFSYDTEEARLKIWLNLLQAIKKNESLILA